MSPVSDALLPSDAKAAIFDCDGTVIDTMPLHWRVWSDTAAKYGLQLDLATFLAYAGTPARGILQDLCTKQGKGDLDIDEAVAWKTEHYMQLVPQVTPIDQVVAIVHAAKARGIPVAISSGGARKHVEAGLRATGLLELFDAVVTCEDYQAGKPAPDCFLLAAKKLGVAPEYCVGYEDADLGMKAIQAANFLKAVDVRLISGYPHLME